MWKSRCDPGQGASRVASSRSALPGPTPTSLTAPGPLCKPRTQGAPNSAHRHSLHTPALPPALQAAVTPQRSCASYPQPLNTTLDNCKKDNLFWLLGFREFSPRWERHVRKAWQAAHRLEAENRREKGDPWEEVHPSGLVVTRPSLPPKTTFSYEPMSIAPLPRSNCLPKAPPLDM